jgi:hypothetical protein
MPVPGTAAGTRQHWHHGFPGCIARKSGFDSDLFMNLKTKNWKSSIEFVRKPLDEHILKF